jgi:hypothetical protein
VLPTLVGSLKQMTGTYSSGLAVLAGLAVVALATLAVAQTEWIGEWIGQHGRVKSEADVAPAPAVMSNFEALTGTQG